MFSVTSFRAARWSCSKVYSLRFCGYGTSEVIPWGKSAFSGKPRKINKQTVVFSRFAAKVSWRWRLPGEFVDVIVKYSEHPWADSRKMPQLQTLVWCSKMDSAFAPRLQPRLLRSSAGKTGGGCPWCGIRCCLMYSAAMPSLFILYTSLHWLVENGVEGVSS